MQPWMWGALWGAVIVVIVALWLRERLAHKGWTGQPSQDDPRGTSDVKMRMNLRGQSQNGGGGF